ncbi:MAG: tetratricopeptide repeat protein [Alphaproteobacteria bacterium]|nr:tetratricopeptide repeat protein [Alphaproteobacteria bacterium]
MGAPVANAAVDPDLFYDANEIVPKGELAKSAPRKMDPAMEPASRLIVVTKDSGPGSRAAQHYFRQPCHGSWGVMRRRLDIYRSLYEKSRKDPQVLMGIAVALQRMGDFDASIAAYQELLDVQPKNTDAEVNMLGLMSEKYPSVALRRLEELRQKDPSNIAVVAQLAVTQAQLNNTEEAIKYLSVAASMQPDNPNHVYNMAVIADRAGNRKEAVKYYEQALDMDSIYGGGRTLPRDVIFERLARLR